MTSSSTIHLPILAFNDVYRVRQKYTAPAGHATRNADGQEPEQAGKPKEEYISVSQFGRTLLDLRNGWETKGQRQNGVKEGSKEGEEKEGLVLFAGDGMFLFLHSGPRALECMLTDRQ
jgi:hypothetical protein